MEQLYFQKCQIKSKYLNEWQNRTICINLHKNKLGISQHGAHLFKYFPLNQVKMEQKMGNILKIMVSQSRCYEIKGQDSNALQEVLRSHKFLNSMGNSCQKNSISVPKKIDYSQYLVVKQVTPEKDLEIIIPMYQEKIKVYTRQNSFFKSKDWAVNNQDGGLILISKQKKQNQGKIIKFVLKKFITTGSFMGISFPVFAMKPESILETYCKSLGSAPIIFEPQTGCPIQRLKQFVSFTISFSQIFTDMDKPFNPTIGETFQAQIAGGKYSAQQISHHPPQSSFIFEGNGYTIWATLELIAQIGLNSATGMIMGDITVQFKDGTRIIGRSLEGQMSGFVLGENKFRPGGSCYAYDPDHKLVCSYKRAERDVFKGHLGSLNSKAQQKFDKILKTNQRFTDFQSFSKDQFKQIDSEVEICWSSYVRFDRKTLLDFSDNRFLPFTPTYDDIELLDSDSRHRQDIQLRMMDKLEEAQEEKQRIEEQERYFKKLRSNYGKKSKK